MEQRPADQSEKPWYESWFDTEWYDILYSDRDEEEAEGFLENLLLLLQPAPDAVMLDLACGNGRYTRFLAEKGYRVVGIDLSEKSILAARSQETPRLSFYQHDMRRPLRVNYFDYVFNFFTSFGYFEKQQDNQQVLFNANSALKMGGTLVLDYFNAEYLRRNLIPENSKVVEGIHFQMRRYLAGDFLVKEIRFEADGEQHFFEERVRLYSLEELTAMLTEAGFTTRHTFGNYRLDAYEEASSKRLIFVSVKNTQLGDDHWLGRTDILLD